MYRWDLLNHLIARLDLRSYLEIGVADGPCFQRVQCARTVGVDPEPHGPMENHPAMIRATSDEFFASFSGPPFDLVFIDGLHHAEQIRRDIDNALKWLTPAGCIVCHDMNPTLEIHQRMPREQVEWTGDVWKTLCWFRQQRTDLEIFTLDIDWGCAVISRRLPLPPNFQANDLTWEFLQAHRTALLNLRPVSYLEDWLTIRE